MKDRTYVSDFPDLLLEWDYERNNGLFSPDKVASGSTTLSINWICKTCGHRWEAPPYRRTRRKSGCPKCAKKLSRLKKGKNDLASQRPDLLNEWDYEANDGKFSPDEIAIGSTSQLVNWKCSACGHKWQTTVYSRAKLNSGCPACESLRQSERNRVRQFDEEKSLVALYPEIAAEWHPTKNLPLDVFKVMPGCNDKVWWLCDICGTEYPAAVCNRTGYKHTGCPTCNKHMHTSFPEQAVFYYVQKLYPNTQSSYTDTFDNQMELDIYIPDIKTGIEYDGCFWHSSSVIERNRKKHSICQENDILLIRVKENYGTYEMCIDDCDVSIIRDDNTDQGLEQTIRSVLNKLSETSIDVNIARDRSKIKSNYITSFREKSLQTRFPDVAAEWHPELNGTLKPDMVMPASADKVWWLCPKCGQPYQASPSKRTRKEASACPVCARKRIVPGINDLATLRPDLAKEWHPTLNGELLPSAVAPNYSKKVWWVCVDCGNEFHVTPNKRISRNQGCDKCSMERRSEEQHKKSLQNGTNTVAALRPDLLKEWDYEQNEGLCTPDDVSAGNASIPIHWVCSVCGNKWQASAYVRVTRNHGCKVCARKRMGELYHSRAVKKGINDVASQRPDLLKEWDYEKNSSICTPDDITIGSNTRVHWTCSTCGYEWCTSPYNRIHNGSGCRRCSRKKKKE